MNVLAEYVIFPIESINQSRLRSYDVDVSLKLIMWWPQYYWKPKQMQLCSGNNYPDCCKHNHLTSAAGEGGEGVILLVLGQTGSPGEGGWHVFVYDWKITLGSLAPVASWDLRCHRYSGGLSLVTFLRGAVKSKTINRERQTVVVQCVSPCMWHVTHVCYAQSEITNYCNFQEVCPPQSSGCLTSVESDHILWVKNNNSWVWVPWTR